MLVRSLSALAAVALATSAYASEPTPYPTKPSTWTGFYVGAHAGYGWADVDWTFEPSTTFLYAPGDTLAFDMDKLLIGGHIGYNYQIGRVVLGVEGALRSGPGRETFNDGITQNSVHIGGIATVAGRLGYAFDGWMGYIKGGYARSEVETIFFFGETEGRVTHHGYVLGIGAEAMVMPNLSIGLEYDYVHLNGKVHQNAPFFDANHRVEADVHSVMARATLFIR
jgi:outer membrane immunogenic protein